MKIKSPSRKEIQMLKNVGGFMGLRYWIGTQITIQNMK
jgi:hypothetical protein